MLARTLALSLFLSVVTSGRARAEASGVGLGVAVGGAYSPTELDHNGRLEPVGGSLIWGFFVDIPLIATFYISPAAMLYELDTGHGKEPATDIDLNFKFIAPIGPVQLGVGLTGGLSNAERTYDAHFGALAYLGMNLVANLDLFAIAQYKRLLRGGPPIDYAQGLVGGMFRF